MKYKMLPIISESDLRDAIFAQYDVELEIWDILNLLDAYNLVYLDPASYGLTSDEPGHTEFLLVLGYLNDVFPQYDAVIVHYDF